MEEVEGLASTRKRKFTKGEVLELLKERGNDLEKVVEEICEELVPFDVNDDEVGAGWLVTVGCSFQHVSFSDVFKYTRALFS